MKLALARAFWQAVLLALTHPNTALALAAAILIATITWLALDHHKQEGDDQ